jgi:hypothetical protein
MSEVRKIRYHALPGAGIAIRIPLFRRGMRDMPKRFFLAGVLILTMGPFVLSNGPIPAEAASAADPGVICTLDAMMESPDLCPASGPAAVRAQYWEDGLLPRQPLPAVPLDPALKTLDRRYAAVSRDRVLQFYPNIDAAVSNRPHRELGPGNIWISYIDVVNYNGDQLLMTGDWKDYVWRGDVGPKDYVTTQFSGFRLAETPARPFGWILEPQGVRASREPGLPADPQGELFPWYGTVEIFDQQEVNGLTWFQVGLNQWIDQKKIGIVFPDTELPEGVPAGAKWISVNLYEQTLAAYEGTRLVFATLTATGLPGWWTRPGLHRIEHKYEFDTMQGGVKGEDWYYVADVPWVMYFDNARAIHGEYWHNSLGYRRSHGCVNVAVADAHWLYDWAPVGTYVWVFDTSGQTPIDPSKYPND